VSTAHPQLDHERPRERDPWLLMDEPLSPLRPGPITVRRPAWRTSRSSRP